MIAIDSLAIKSMVFTEIGSITTMTGMTAFRSSTLPIKDGSFSLYPNTSGYRLFYIFCFPFQITISIILLYFFITFNFILCRSIPTYITILEIPPHFIYIRHISARLIGCIWCCHI